MVRYGNKPPSQRQLRVGESLRHSLANALTRGHFRDPALADPSAITVTEVRVSPDLKNATVFVVPLAGRDSGEAVAGLNRAAGLLRRMIGPEMELRYLPHLEFELDRTFDEVERIETILRNPRVQADLDHEDDTHDPDDDEAGDEAGDRGGPASGGGRGA